MMCKQPPLCLLVYLRKAKASHCSRVTPCSSARFSAVIAIGVIVI